MSRPSLPYSRYRQHCAGLYLCVWFALIANLCSPLQGAKGALASVNLLNNDIGVAQAQALVKIKNAGPLLGTLCGLTIEQTELDMSGRYLGPSDVVLLASDIDDHPALAKLDISGNHLCPSGRKKGTYDARGLAALHPAE